MVTQPTKIEDFKEGMIIQAGDGNLWQTVSKPYKNAIGTDTISVKFIRGQGFTTGQVFVSNINVILSQISEGSIRFIDNPFDGVAEYIGEMSHDIDPKNNDGRSTCFKCGAPTKPVQLFSSIGNVCTQCGA